MKRALIVHAHPEPLSFVASLRDTAVATLQQRGMQVTVSDLYADGFDPIAKAADFHTRSNSDYLNYALEQRHAFQNRTLAPDIDRELSKLLEADLVVFTFPIFWFSVPAILKGWFDRVFISGAIYGGRRFYDRGGMRGKRALVCASFGGRDYMFDKKGIHGELLVLLSPLLRGTLGYAGFDVLEPFFAFHVPYIEAADRQKILKRWEDHIGRFDTLATLPSPSLSDYDDKMQPLK